MDTYTLHIYTFGKLGEYHWRAEFRLDGRFYRDVVGGATQEFIDSLPPHSSHISRKGGINVGDLVPSFMTPQEALNAGLEMYKNTDYFENSELCIEFDNVVAENKK